MPRPDRVSLDAEGHVGSQADRLLGACGVRDVTVAFDQGPLRRRSSIVEYGLADELDFDASLEAEHIAHEHVVGVVVCRRARVGCDLVLAAPRTHGERVADQNPARRRVPGGSQRVRPRLVAPGGGNVDPERPHPEGPGLTIEQAPEDALRVEARNTEPIDGAVGCDERSGMAVREERVIGDRREWRRSCSGLRTPLRQCPRRRLRPLGTRPPQRLWTLPSTQLPSQNHQPP